MVNTKKIDHYLESLKDKFIVWENVFVKYENELSSNMKYDTKFKEPLYKAICVIFAEILKTFSIISNTNDEWTFPSPNFQPIGANVSTKSKKTNIEISFVFYENKFFLETVLLNPKDLNKVSDNFWLNMLQLRNYGSFDFEGEEPSLNYNNVHIEKRYKTNSNIFRLIKNFIFLDLTEGNLVDLGILQIKWPRNTSWKDLIRNGCYGFELLYKINKEIISKDNLKYSSEF